MADTRSKVEISFIVAVAQNGVIGRDGALPWRLSSDLKMFRRMTMGKPVIMGRRTWQSLFRQPLDGRDNIVITRDRAFQADGAHVVCDADEAVAKGRECAAARGAAEIMVIGGAQVYRSLMSRVFRIYWTQVHADVEGDTSLPPLDPKHWREVSREPIPRSPSDEFTATLVIYERIQP